MRSPARGLHLMLLLAACAAGCKTSPYADDGQTLAPPPVPPKSPAPKPSWETTYVVKLTFVGGGSEFEKAYCDFKLLAPKDELTFQMSCAHLPHPVSVTFEGKTTESGSTEYDTFEFTGDFTTRLGAAKLSALKDKNNPKLEVPITVTMEFGGFEPMKVTPPALWTMAEIFHAWAGKPVIFSENPPPDDGKKSAVLVHEGYSGHELIGEGATFDDLDFIAVQRDLESPAISCFGGRLVYRTEADVTLYDRRSGGTVDTHHFKATNAGCPDQAIVGGSVQYQGAVGPDLIKPWLKTRILKK